MEKTAFLVAGLAYGDEGKGATVDFLARQHNAGLVVRYNGGAQAAHNVVLPDGKHHTFSQFGAATFVPGVRTHLSRFMLVNPLNMFPEEENLRKLGIRDAWQRLTVSKEALIITPFQRALNRLQEMNRGDSRHGSCGQGVGQCRSDFLKYGTKVLQAGDLWSEQVTKRKLHFLQEVCLQEACTLDIYNVNDVNVQKEIQTLTDLSIVNWCWEQYKKWPAKIEDDKLAIGIGIRSIIFEGAQGVLLDETHGEAPYNTWTDTTFNNAHTLLDEAGFRGKRMEIGVLRTYATRHGVGPFPTESTLINHPELHNGKNEYQGAFRQGSFNIEEVFKALRIVKDVHGVALNHIDRIPRSTVISSEELVGWFEGLFRVPVVIEGRGPTHLDRIWKGK